MRKLIELLLLAVLTITGGCGCSHIVADAGEDKIVQTKIPITLDGSGSTTEWGPLIYRWTLTTPRGSHAVLKHKTTATPTFTPDLAGRYTARLFVKNLFNEKARDEQVSTAAPANQCMYRPMPRKKPKFRIFCFPYAGQGAQIYDTWLGSLSEDVELVGIMFPGRFYRAEEEPIARLNMIVDEIYRDIAPLTDVPYVFFGHCMGALIGFEVTDKLEREGKTGPIHLIMSGTPAPHLPVYEERSDLHDLPEDELIEFLLAIGLIDNEIAAHPEDHLDLFSWIRSDFEMVDTWAYTPGMTVTPPITAFGGQEDISATEQQIEAWQEVTDSGFEYHMFPGGHFYTDNSREEIVAIINTLIDGYR